MHDVFLKTNRQLICTLEVRGEMRPSLEDVGSPGVWEVGNTLRCLLGLIKHASEEVRSGPVCVPPGTVSSTPFPLREATGKPLFPSLHQPSYGKKPSFKLELGVRDELP